MLYLFYGDNSFFIRQKLAATKERYLAKYPSGLNLYKFDLGENSDGLETTIGSQSMFGEKRLLLLRGTFTIDETSWSSVEKTLKNTREVWQSEDVVLVFYDFVSPASSLKKRLEFFRKNGRVEEFPGLKPHRAVEWALEEVRRLGLNLSTDAAAYLVGGVGADLERLSRELSKLWLYQEGRAVTKEALDELVAFDVKANSFDFAKALLNKNVPLALKNLECLRLKGEDPLMVLGALVWQFRNVLKLADCSRESARTSARGIGLKPWVVEKSLAALARFSVPELKNIYQRLVDADVAIKTGEKEGYEALSDFVYGFLPRKTTL